MTYREAINLGEKVLNMADVADAKIDALYCSASSMVSGRKVKFESFV